MGVHDGHRARMKARFVRNGLDNFDDHSVLELLLFYAVPRRDVNELAHALLDHFGTLDAVFEASCEDMMRVPGVVSECLHKAYSLQITAKATMVDMTSEYT